MIIISGAIIFLSQKNNPSKNANIASYRSDIDTLQDKYTMHYGELLAQAQGDKSKIQDSDLESIIPDKYKDEFKATTDGIKYIGDNEEHKEIAKEMGIEIGDRPEIPVINDVKITADDTSAYIEADVTESRSGIVEYNFKIIEKNGTF